MNKYLVEVDSIRHLVDAERLGFDDKTGACLLWKEDEIVAVAPSHALVSKFTQVAE